MDRRAFLASTLLLWVGPVRRAPVREPLLSPSDFQFEAARRAYVRRHWRCAVYQWDEAAQDYRLTHVEWSSAGPEVVR